MKPRLPGASLFASFNARNTMPTRRISESSTEGLTDETAVTVPNSAALIDEPTAADIEENSIVTRLRSMMSGTGADRVRLRLYRVNPKKKGPGDWCEDLSPEEFEENDLSEIRTRWGPGEYEIRLIGSGGVAGSMRVSIAPTPDRSATVAPQSDIAQALEALARNQQALIEAITNRPAPDPNAEMERTMRMMIMMREAMGVQPTPAPSADPMAMVSKVFDMVRTAKQSVKELTDDERQDAAPTDPLSMLPKIMDTVQMFARQQPAPQTTAAPVIALPQSIAAAPALTPPTGEIPAPANQPTTENQPMNLQQMVIAGIVQRLDEMHANNTPLQDVGEFLADKLPDEILPYLDLPNWFDLLCMIAPSLREREEWVRSVKPHLDAALNEPEPE